MAAVMCVSLTRDSGLTRKSGNDSLDETKLELEENLRVQHYSLSVDDNNA